MNYTEPLLFRFKKRTMSPRRIKLSNTEEYDYALDMTTIVIDGVKKPAIETAYRFGTKKADVERGEDQKDSLMWQ
jgi:hypothetical protein